MPPEPCAACRHLAGHKPWVRGDPETDWPREGNKGVTLLRTITRRTATALVTAATAGAVAMSLVGTAASAGTISTTNSAGYQVSGAQIRYVQTTVYARSLAQYNATMGAGFGHGITLTSSSKTVSLGISVYQGETASSPWDAGFDVTNTSGGSQVGGCLAGNASGTGGVVCNTSTTGEPGAFAPGNVTMSVYYNKINGVLSFDAYQGSNDFHGFINLGPGLSFNVVNVGTTLANPASVKPPASAQLLGRFTGTVLTNYLGRQYTLTGPWTTSKVQATGPGSVKIATASALSSGGAAFSTYLQP